MKIREFDYRLWCKEDNTYWSFNDEQQRIIPKNDDVWEIELWSGLKDCKGRKIFEGDIVAHCNGDDIEYHSKIVFNPQKICFEFVCIEHPAICTFDKLQNSDLKVIGNIHENADLL